MTDQEAQNAVDTYRQSYSDIPDFWWRLDAAARDTIATRQSNSVGKFTFYYDKPFLFIRLPSGRSLAYFNPKIEMKETPWGKMQPTITYEGMDLTKKWSRTTTHPGKITENIVQAISRDVLVGGLRKAKEEGFSIVGHVHDEIITEQNGATAEEDLQKLLGLMGAPYWCNDAPVKAAGYVSPFYMKD